MHPPLSITRSRLHNQHLTGTPAASTEELLRRLGAVQSQDYVPGKWSIAQRTADLTNATIDEQFAAGAILRTHVLRPTWHFVLPEDIRWLLELTGPRVQIQAASFYRTQELAPSVFDACNAVIEAALYGGRHRTRTEIGTLLTQAGVMVTPLRLGAIVMNAELNGLICSGAPRGKQQTYALLTERAPQARRLDRELALAELTFRYFTGHGPASVKDFRWWSSLMIADIHAGLEMVGSRLERVTMDGVTYWYGTPELDSEPLENTTVHLVQGYDEYIVGYAESKTLIDASGIGRSLPRARGIYTHAILLDGQVAGEWKPVVKKHAVTIEATLFVPFEGDERDALNQAVMRYGEFSGGPVRIVLREKR